MPPPSLLISDLKRISRRAGPLSSLPSHFHLLKCISSFSYHCDVERREIHLANELVTPNISVLNRQKNSGLVYVTPQREPGFLKQSSGQELNEDIL